MGFFSSFHSDKFSTHQGQCGSCAHSSVSTSRLSCYCNKRRATYKLDEPKCRYYENDRSRNYDFWRDIYKNNELYQEFVALIQLVRSDASMEKEAVAYNAFGPMIATSLYQDPNGVELCKNLLTTYLAKAFIAIKENRQEDAIRIYEDMVKFLFVRYRNVEDFSNIIDQNQFANSKVMIKK